MRSTLALALLLVASPALACGPDRLERGVLARAAPDGDLHLTDGRVLRLAGLHRAESLPLPIRPGERIAFGLLDESDRWARLPALVFALPDGGEPVWLQEHLAAGGRAAVRFEPALGSCWPLLQAAEAKAAAPLMLAVEPGRYARVEGRVSRVGEGRSAQFVTVFDGSGQRVTGIIQKRHLKRIQQAGVDVAGLRGHIVRLRGVRSLRNPHAIQLSRAEQIEIVR
jgi:hypothetical protein